MMRLQKKGRPAVRGELLQTWGTSLIPCWKPEFDKGKREHQPADMKITPRGRRGPDTTATHQKEKEKNQW